MQAAEQLEELGPSFEQRYYELLRRQSLASEIGGVALSGYEKRFYDELTSGLAEALKGVISTQYRLSLRKGRVIAEDGEEVVQMLERARAENFVTITKDKFYLPFLMQRTNHEFDELQEMEAMASGETEFNTILTFSPYSEEFAQTDDDKEKLRAIAQKPHLKRAMVRMSHWDGSQLHIFTRSIDNSSVEMLKDVARQKIDYLMEAQNSTDLLGERIHLNIDNDSWQLLPDEITATSDRILQERYGGSWNQGRKIGEDKDLQVYVESEKEVVQKLISIADNLSSEHNDFKSWKQAFNSEVYKYVALLEANLENDSGQSFENIETAAYTAGLVAHADGKVYDMCGLMLRGENETTMAVKTGFESLVRSVKSEFDSEWCPNCLPEKKPGKKVKAWRKGDRIGCKNCKHEIDYSDPCWPKVIKQGKKS